MTHKWEVPLTLNFGERVGTAEVFEDSSGIRVTAVIDESMNEAMLEKVRALAPEPTLSIAINEDQGRLKSELGIPRDALCIVDEIVQFRDTLGPERPLFTRDEMGYK